MATATVDEESLRRQREETVSIAPHEPHSFVNNSGAVLEFLCMNYLLADMPFD